MMTKLTNIILAVACLSVGHASFASDVADSATNPHHNKDVIAMLQGTWQCEVTANDPEISIKATSVDTIKGNKWHAAGEMTFYFHDSDMPPLVVQGKNVTRIAYKNTQLEETSEGFEVLSTNKHEMADVFKKMLEHDGINRETSYAKVVHISKNRFVTRFLEEDNTVVSCKR